MYKVNNQITHKLAEGVKSLHGTKTKTVGEIASKCRMLSKAIENIQVQFGEARMLLCGEIRSDPTAVNGIPIDENREDTADFISYRSFLKALELARAVNPDATAIVHSGEVEFYITDVDLKVWVIEDNNPDFEPQLGCWVVLH